MKLTILGCGAASGLPMIGVGWGDCDPANPRNRRLRASVLVQARGKNLLVDTSPDMRQQLLGTGTTRLDGIIFTHTHADHTHGIDEVRQFNRFQKSAIDAWATRPDLDYLINKFDYIFDLIENNLKGLTFYKPQLVTRELHWGQIAQISGVPVLPFGQDHGFSMTTGLRFGPIAYSTDVVRLDEAAFEALKGVRVWVIGCLQEAEHPTHANLSRVLEWIDRVGPERAILTHLAHRMDYETLRAKCPSNVEPAYDGMCIEIASEPATNGGWSDSVGPVLIGPMQISP